MDDKYYDERCPDCDTCGWRKDGEYLDGRPYEACGWYGYILHGTVMAKCKAYRTPEGVAGYLSRNAKKVKR